MDLIQNGMKDRLKKINTIRMLGTGIDIGELNAYAHEIALYLLLSIFRREITENTNRTRNDMLYMVTDIIRDMQLEGTDKNIERIVDGLLWYKDPDRQEPFECPIYNEEERIHETYKFRYLKEDREHSHWEKGGSTVYMLTEEAQEIIFITREMLEEFGFDVEQFYTLQLIKSGNFNKAINSVSNLIARVKTLIRREKDYRVDMVRNPQIIFFDNKRDKRKSEQEIKNQFEDEKKIFEDMLAWKSRLENFPKDKQSEGEELFEEVEKARVLHNQLAKTVIDNIAYEIKVRVNYPESFWITSRVSFKKDIWQNVIVKNRLPSFELLENLVAPLLSPEIDFIYPLDWAWEEQVGFKESEDENADETSSDEKEEFKNRSVVNWELIVELWEPIFDKLIEEDDFCIVEIGDRDTIYQQKWLSERRNIEIFMMFVITNITLNEIDSDFEKMDERAVLFTKLCKKNKKYKKLIGRTIVSKLEESKQPLSLETLFVSPYTIFMKD